MKKQTTADPLMEKILRELDEEVKRIIAETPLPPLPKKTSDFVRQSTIYSV